MSDTNTIYLIHFEKPYQHARHYLGFTTDLPARIADHRASVGSRLLQVVNDAGIGWEVARTWKGDRKFERQLKRRKETPALCPRCAGDAAWKRARKAGNQ
jgi:predicted GIY-YIG superfamily endonuclease